MDGETFDAVVQRVSVTASRRGLLRAGVGALAAGALAAAQGRGVTARTRQPEAFALARVDSTSIAFFPEPFWQVSVTGDWHHPDSGNRGSLGIETDVDGTLSPAQVRSEVIDAVRRAVITDLRNVGQDVAAGRVAVTLL